MLVHGGTSGIGTMAIALCKAFGIATIVTCDRTINARRSRMGRRPMRSTTRRRDFVEEVKRLTGGAGVQLPVLDMVGGDYLPRNLACLAEDGRHVSIAVLGGTKAELFIPQIMTRRLTLTGSTLRPRTPAFKAGAGGGNPRKRSGRFRRGRLAAGHGPRLSAGRGRRAHRRIEAGEHFGKIVLKVR